MKGLSFSIKFAIILSVTVLVAVGIVGWRLLSISSDTLASVNREYYTVVARSVSDRLEERSSEIVKMLFQAQELLSTSQLSGQATINVISSSLQKMQYTNAIGVYDINGNYLTEFSKGGKKAAPRSVPRDILDTLKTAPSAIGKPAPIGAEGLPVIPIAVKWSDSEGNGGILMSVIENNSLCQFVSQASAEAFQGKTDRIYLVNDSLLYVAHHVRAFVASRESLAGKGIFAEVKPGERISFSRELGLTKEYVNASGESMLGIYSSVASLHLAIIVEQPQSVVYRSLYEMQRNLLWSSLLIAALAVGISLLVARQLSKPISQLVDASEKLAMQDFSVRLDENRGDEFGILFQTHNRVAAELELYNNMNVNKIVSARNKLESVVQQASDGIIVVEPSRHILVLNSVFARWFGVENAKITEQTTVDKLFTNIHVKHAVAKAFVSKETVMPVEFTVQLPGEVRETVLRGTFVRVLYGSELIAVTGILRDVTREVAIDRMKTELVSIVAHELRSPLNTMRGFSELIRKGDLPPEENVEFAEIITTEADRLNGVITKFLDINRIESGRTEIQRIPFKIHELIGNVLRVNMPLAEQKQMRVDVDMPNNTTPIVGDPELVGQVFLNLFSNAVKYSDPNKLIKVEVREDADKMYIAVEDQGYGISESAQEKLFSKFFRATDDDRVRNNVGTGLGLAFIKEIVEKHDGQIGCKSQLNKGSTFWFTLPK
jgi:two-component system phosphate regulon sensor histidine kinase PhoR